MCRQFGIAKQDNFPVAPITLSADGGEPSNAHWLRADPVHLRINRDQLILVDSKAFSISEAEAIEFTNKLNQHFGADNLIFQPLHPTRWYLRYPSDMELRCTSLQDATGRNIDALLPTGKEARRFRSLFNEAQMVLFSHPLNEARESAGQLPINSVWFWGNGKMPVITRPSITGLCGNDELARSLASLTKIPVADLPTDVTARLLRSDEKGEQWIVLDALQAPRQYSDAYGWQQALAGLDKNWFSPLLRELQAGQLGGIVITGFGDNQSIEIQISKNDLWKFWRRDRQFVDIL
jgi:hypothetical protein